MQSLKNVSYCISIVRGKMKIVESPPHVKRIQQFFLEEIMNPQKTKKELQTWKSTPKQPLRRVLGIKYQNCRLISKEVFAAKTQ